MAEVSPEMTSIGIAYIDYLAMDCGRDLSICLYDEAIIGELYLRMEAARNRHFLPEPDQTSPEFFGG